MTIRRAAWGMGLFTTVVVLLLVGVVLVIDRPVAGRTDSYDALFTDANGLKVGDDVRMYGVRVGRVGKIRLDGTLARVHVVLDTTAPVYDNSRFAIRYQNLTGQRYVDLQQPPHPGTRLGGGGRTIDTDRTVPSFDVTATFNGLQPILTTMSPQAINQLTASLVALVEGDGSGLGPAMAALETLALHADGRQQVLRTLIENLAQVSAKVGGRAQYLVPLLARLTDIFQALQSNIGGLEQFVSAMPSILGPLDRLLSSVGLDDGDDVDALIRRVFPEPGQAVNALEALPSLLAGLDAVARTGAQHGRTACSSGAAQVPPVIAVVIAGQKVTVCNR
ncbi:MlaD family protein [Nocardia sp. NPDC056064]|uniref:MlaD family protein n=1 Tax=Nocardia sp. NPDC056064 TaxID=3345701 RepID=UPI0035DDB012